MIAHIVTRVRSQTSLSKRLKVSNLIIKTSKTTTNVKKHLVRAQDKIIVALDVPSLDKARQLVEDLAPYVWCFKVGLELLTAVGTPKVVKFIHLLGGEVFYDGKFDDIPNTVAEAAKVIANLNVKMFSVHASAGRRSIEAAVANRGNTL